jgi:hypothetical protein
MTPAKRRPTTPASQGPTRTAPDVPVVAEPGPVPAAKAKDGTQPSGPEGERVDDSAPSTETGHSAPEDRATTPSARRRPGGLYPLPVWPD